MKTRIIAEPVALDSIEDTANLEEQEKDYYKKTFAQLKTAMEEEYKLLLTTTEKSVRIEVSTIFKEFLIYNNSLPRLVNSNEYLLKDLACLCRMHGVTLSETFSKTIQNIQTELASPRFESFLGCTIPNKLQASTVRIFEKKQLTPTEYRLFNNYILQRTDISSILTPESAYLGRYTFIQEFRLLIPFYAKLYNTLQIKAEQRSPEEKNLIERIDLSSRKLFGTKAESAPIYKKIVFSTALHKSDIDFQQGLKLVNDQIINLEQLLKDKNIQPETPAVKLIFTLLSVNKKSGLPAIAKLLELLTQIGAITSGPAKEIQNNFRIGIALLIKATNHYRELINTPDTLNNEYTEHIIVRIVSGSDFINTNKFLIDLLKSFPENLTAENQRLLATILKILITKQSDFIRFDNFAEDQKDIESTIQLQEIELAIACKNILKNLLMQNNTPENPELPLPILQALLLFYKFMLDLIYKDKSRSYIVSTNLTHLIDNNATPNYFTFFRQVKKLNPVEELLLLESDIEIDASAAPQNNTGKIVSKEFEPVPQAFEKIANIYNNRVPSSELMADCDPTSIPKVIKQFNYWLLVHPVQKIAPAVPPKSQAD